MEHNLQSHKTIFFCEKYIECWKISVKQVAILFFNFSESMYFTTSWSPLRNYSSLGTGLGTGLAAGLGTGLATGLATG